MKNKRRPPRVLPCIEIMRTEDAARYLQVSTQYLEIARFKGGGPLFCKIGRLVRYRKSTLDAWVAAREISSTRVELDKPSPNETKLMTLFTLLTQSVRTLPAAKPAYDAAKALLATVGVSLP